MDGVSEWMEGREGKQMRAGRWRRIPAPAAVDAMTHADALSPSLGRVRGINRPLAVAAAARIAGLASADTGLGPRVKPGWLALPAAAPAPAPQSQVPAGCGVLPRCRCCRPPGAHACWVGLALPPPPLAPQQLALQQPGQPQSWPPQSPVLACLPHVAARPLYPSCLLPLHPPPAAGAAATHRAALLARASGAHRHRSPRRQSQQGYAAARHKRWTGSAEAGVHAAGMA